MQQNSRIHFLVIGALFLYTSFQRCMSRNHPLDDNSPTMSSNDPKKLKSINQEKAARRQEHIQRVAVLKGMGCPIQ